MNECFMIGRNGSGGGSGKVTLRRTGAIGDALCATVVSDRLMDLGADVIFQSHPHCHPVLRRNPRLTTITEPVGTPTVNLDQSYERDPNRRQKHFHTMFFEAAQAQVAKMGVNLGPPTNCRPRLLPCARVAEATQQRHSVHPRPWVMVCPRSQHFPVRTVTDGVWTETAKLIQGTCFWLGMHPAPEGFIDAHCRQISDVLAMLYVADLMISVDTGPLHIAAALGVPCVAINQSSSPSLHLSDQCDFVEVSPELECLNCQKNVCPKNAYIPPCQNVPPTLIAAAANARLSRPEVSAIVAIYQPEVTTLNRCLEAALPQVDEIIVTGELNSRIPKGALQHSKIRYVTKPSKAIGYGRNANFGARHSSGKFLLLLNDDVFLDPGAVAALRHEMSEGVGAAGQFLRYPSGRIYHAGKVRMPGWRGWGHVDHNKFEPSIKEAQEAENLCGASVMVRREAFYQMGGFDEDYFLYAEDDDFMLRLRLNGWRLRYTPFATGIHMEGQSTRKLGQPMEYVQKANALFGHKWGAYLDWNINRVPGNFDYRAA